MASVLAFTRKIAGAIAEGIDVVCLPLPSDLRRMVDPMVREEVSPTAATAAVAAKVETELESPDSTG